MNEEKKECERAKEIDTILFTACEKYKTKDGTYSLGSLRAATREIQSLIPIHDHKLGPDEDGDYGYLLLLKNGKKLNVYHCDPYCKLSEWLLNNEQFDPDYDYNCNGGQVIVGVVERPSEK